MIKDRLIYPERDNILSSIGFSSYSEYLKSDLWKEIKEGFDIKNSKCIYCYLPAHTLHHKSYTKANLLGSSKNFLTPVCKSCHYLLEFSFGRKLNKKKELHYKYKDLLNAYKNCICRMHIGHRGLFKRINRKTFLCKNHRFCISLRLNGFIITKLDYKPLKIKYKTLKNKHPSKLLDKWIKFLICENDDVPDFY